MASQKNNSIVIVHKFIQLTWVYMRNLHHRFNDLDLLRKTTSSSVPLVAVGGKQRPKCVALRKCFSNAKDYQPRLSAKGVRVVKGATFLQVAVNVEASPPQLSLADPEQVIHEDVAVKELQLQSVAFQSVEVPELLLPPGVFVVVANSRFTQNDGAKIHFDVAIGLSQETRGKVAGSQVKHRYLSFSHAQTAKDQEEERETVGHGAGK